MTDILQISHAHLRAMVTRSGCLDAASATIEARWGIPSSKGTLSRKMSGSLDWTLRDLITFEDALGTDTVSRVIGQRWAGNRVSGCNKPLGLDDVSDISLESGQAVSKILRAMQSNCAGDRAEAIKEIDDAVAELMDARRKLAGGVE